MKNISLIALKVLIIFFFCLYLLIWLVSPFVSQHYIQKSLDNYGVVLSQESSVRYNPFISQITINDLSIQKNNDTVLEIENLTVEMSLFRLLIKEIYISSLTAQGIEGKVEILEDKMIIAGIEIPQSAPTEKQEETSDAPDYQLVMPTFEIKKSVIDLTLQKTDLKVELNNITLNNLLADQHAQSAELISEIALGKSIFQLNADADLIQGQGEIISSININQFELAQLLPWLPKNITKLSGLINFNSQQKIQFNDSSTYTSLDNTNFTLSQLAVEQEDITLSVESNAISFPKAEVILNKDESLTVLGKGEFNTKNINIVKTQQPHLTLSHIENVSVDDISITSPEFIPTVVLNKIVINNVIVSDNKDDDAAALTQFKELTLNDVTISQLATDINTIFLSDLVVDARINENKVLTSFSPLLAKNSEEDQKKLPQQETVKELKNNAEEKESYQFSLNEFQLSNTANITFVDASMQPTFQQSLTLDKFSLTNINSRSPDQDGLLIIEGKNNQYAHINVNGILKPFLEKPFYAVKGEIKEVSLPAISAYVKDSLNYEIKSGQLDFSIDTKLSGDDVSGDANILLRGIDFTAANDHEVDSIKDQTAIPFSVALGMLKDSQGNVDLSLPLSGNINDPSFGVSGFMGLLIKQATMMAAKDYLMTTFVPYANVVSIAMSAGEMLLKVRFNDLEFSPKETELAASHQTFLQQFSTLMNDKPDTQITLCAIATPEDADLPLGKKITDKTIIDDLHQLSLKRTHNFKQLMTSKHNIASSRLLLCTPQIDSAKDAKPRISFSS